MGVNRRSIRTNPLLLASLFAAGVLGYILVDSSALRFSGTAQSASLARANAVQAEATNTLQELNIDSDRDGLPDWKELLYHTDPKRADTDGDGTPDGTEMREGRDPTVPGPNDRISYLRGLEATTTSISAARRKFLEAYLRQAGRQIQEDTFKQIVSTFDSRPFTSKYALSDLFVDPASGTSTYREFGNTFGKTIDRYLSAGVRSEDDIVDELSRVREDPQKSRSVLAELERPAAHYRNFAADLSKLRVPLELSQYHLLIVNGYDIMSRSLLEMKKLYDNPVQGAGAYQAYMRAKYDVTRGYAGLVVSFARRGVVFERSEPGAPFTWPPGGRETQSAGSDSASSTTKGE